MFNWIETPPGITKQATDLLPLNLDTEPTAAVQTPFPAVFEKIGYIFFANNAKSVPVHPIANAIRKAPQSP